VIKEHSQNNKNSVFGIGFSQFVVQTQMNLYIILRLPPRLAKRRLVYVISAFWRKKTVLK